MSLMRWLKSATKNKHEAHLPEENVVKFEEEGPGKLLSEFDNDILIKQEDLNLKVNEYSATCDTSTTKTQVSVESLQSILTNLEHMHANGSISLEGPDKYTEEPPFQLKCHSCKITFDLKDSFIEHIKQVHKLDPGDPNHYCQPCDKKYSSRRAFTKHLRGVHKVFLYPPVKRKSVLATDSNIEPDPIDPNFNCRSCKTQYKNRKSYRKHLITVHKSTVPTYNQHRLFHNGKPDPNNPDFYCQPCDRKFVALKVFRYHITSAHKIPLVPLIRPKSIPNPNIQPKLYDPDFYCISCDRKFPDHDGYRQHLRQTHKMKLQLLRQRGAKPDHSIKPDPDDPNFFCKSCNASYETLGLYRSHLRHVHKIYSPLYPDKPKPNPDIVPDPNDPNFYCKSCDFKHSHRHLFRQHLRQTHKMKLTSFRSHESHRKDDIVPDPNNPNFFCRACEIKYQTRKYFRRHLVNIHKMVLTRPNRKLILIRNKDVEPDPNDPNFFCGACETKHKDGIAFRRHLRQTHEMVLPRPKRKVNKTKTDSNLNS